MISRVVVAPPPPAPPRPEEGYDVKSDFQNFLLTLFPTAYFFHGSHGGGGIHPPYGKYTLEFLSPILFYTVNYTYIRSSDPKGFFPSFKTLNLAVDQSSAAKSTYASNFRKSKIYKGKSTADFFGGPPKINRGT